MDLAVEANHLVFNPAVFCALHSIHNLFFAAGSYNFQP
jgi:hypothetical protein